jgi:hypothetical protein
MGRWSMTPRVEGAEASVRSFGGKEGSSEIEEMQALITYFDAHRYLPEAEDEEEDEVEGLDEEELTLWGAVLSDPDAGFELLLEGLILLAHTPNPKSLEILESYTASPHAGFELIAELARDECSFWLGQARRSARKAG